jgi:hypothetical protein
MPSIIVPTPSQLRHVMSWPSTQRPPALTVHVVTTLSSLASHAHATPIFGTPASSLAWLAPSQCLHPRAVPSAAIYLSPSPSSEEISTIGLDCPRANYLVIHNASPTYGTCTHWPHCCCPCPAHARGWPHPAVHFTSRTAPPLPIGVSPLHLYVCARTSVECVCVKCSMCVMCVLSVLSPEPPVLHQQALVLG